MSYRYGRAVRTMAAGMAIGYWASAACAQPTLTNGSLTDTAASSSAAAGWTVWQGSPDVVDAAGPFNNTGLPWAASPDGGTFARAIGNLEGLSEAFAQVVSGFSPGTSYDLSYFVTNLGFQVASTDAWIGQDGGFDLLIDGVLADSTVSLSKPASPTDPIVWVPGTMTFTATAATHELALVGRTDSDPPQSAYVGIDGLSLRVVPTPATGAVLLGLAATFGSRRRSAGHHSAPSPAAP